MRDPQAFWNARYADAGFADGTAPNDFVVEVATRVTLTTMAADLYLRDPGEPMVSHCVHLDAPLISDQCVSV